MKTLLKIRDIYRAIIEYESSLEKMYRIGLNESMLLCYLSEEEKATSGEIASRLGLTNSNTSKIIRSAENKGLIKRIVGKVDRRQMFFILTNEGRKRVSAVLNAELELPPVLKEAIKQ